MSVEAEHVVSTRGSELRNFAIKAEACSVIEAWTTSQNSPSRRASFRGSLHPKKLAVIIKPTFCLLLSTVSYVVQVPTPYHRAQCTIITCPSSPMDYAMHVYFPPACAPEPYRKLFLGVCDHLFTFQLNHAQHIIVNRMPALCTTMSGSRKAQQPASILHYRTSGALQPPKVAVRI